MPDLRQSEAASIRRAKNPSGDTDECQRAPSCVFQSEARGVGGKLRRLRRKTRQLNKAKFLCCEDNVRVEPGSSPLGAADARKSGESRSPPWSPLLRFPAAGSRVLLSPHLGISGHQEERSCSPAGLCSPHAHTRASSPHCRPHLTALLAESSCGCPARTLPRLFDQLRDLAVHVKWSAHVALRVASLHRATSAGTTWQVGVVERRESLHFGKA